jgi:glycosyltransferase involved in cell wall biosynthesis
MRVIYYHPIFAENAQQVAHTLNCQVLFQRPDQPLVTRPKEKIIIFGAHQDYVRLLEGQKLHQWDLTIFQSENLAAKVFEDPRYIDLLKTSRVLSWSPTQAKQLQDDLDLAKIDTFAFDCVHTGGGLKTQNDRPYDLGFVGYTSPDREALLQELREVHPELKIFADTHYGLTDQAQLTNVLTQCKYVLNIPFHKPSMLSTHRITKALACGCGVISPPSACPVLDSQFEPYVHFGNLLDLVNQLGHLPPKKSFADFEQQILVPARETLRATIGTEGHPSHGLSICLNMIVRDEVKNLPNCFESLLPYIRDYVIVDTGSQDGTPQFIQTYFSDKRPGHVFEREWQNFCHNRNEALQLAREHSDSDFILFIDADEQLVPDTKDPDALGKLAATLNLCDRAMVRVESGNVTFTRTSLVRRTFCSNKPKSTCKSCEQVIAPKPQFYAWEDPCHEMVASVPEERVTYLQAYTYYTRGGGFHNRQPNQYLNDARLFEKELMGSPWKPRYLFYCGQSFECAGRKKEAMHYYRLRLTVEGYTEEKYMSALRIARILRESRQCRQQCECKTKPIQSDEQRCDTLLLQAAGFAFWAMSFSPNRAEAYVMLAWLARLTKAWSTCMLYARKGLDLLEKYPPERHNYLFHDIHAKRDLLRELALGLYYTGDLLAALDVSREIRAMPDATDFDASNREWTVKGLGGAVPRLTPAAHRSAAHTQIFPNVLSPDTVSAATDRELNDEMAQNAKLWNTWMQGFLNIKMLQFAVQGVCTIPPALPDGYTQRGLLVLNADVKDPLANALVVTPKDGDPLCGHVAWIGRRFLSFAWNV